MENNYFNVKYFNIRNINLQKKIQLLLNLIKEKFFNEGSIVLKCFERELSKITYSMSLMGVISLK